MKTASEIASLIMDQYVDSQEAEDLIKTYAKDLINEALQEASECALMIDDGTSNYNAKSIDKQSILNIEIELP